MRFRGEAHYLSAADIYEGLKEDILSLKIPPGTLISENDVSKQYGLSRTPVRAAFSKLKSDGLVEIIPQKGTFVSLLDLDYINQVIYMRMAVESAVLADAIRCVDDGLLANLRENLAQQQGLISQPKIDTVDYYRLDTEMHKYCFAHVGKLKLWGILNKFQDHYTRFRMLDVVNASTFGLLYKEHMELYSMIEKKEIDKVQAYMQKHLYGSLNRLKDVIKGEYRSYFTNS